MKRVTLILALALSVVGCKRKTEPVNPDSSKGNIEFKLEASTDTYVVETKASGETATVPAVPLSEFGVVAYNEQGAEAFKYDSFTSMPDAVTVDAGRYSIKASNGKLKSAGFDSPWFYGSTDAVVNVGQTTFASIECAISNVKLTIDYTDKFKSMLENVKITVSSIYDNSDPANPGVGALAFGIDETRASWYAAPYNGIITIYITGTNVKNGSPVNLKAQIADVEARQWRKVNIDIKTSGDISLSLNVNEEILVLPEITVIVPDGDDIIDNNGDNGNWEQEPGGDVEEPKPDVKLPSITGLAFGNDESSAPFNLNEVVNFTIGEDTVLDILIESEVGIKNLFLLIESEALTNHPDQGNILAGVLGINGEIDLANPEAGSVWADMFAQDPILLIDPEHPIAGKTSHDFRVGGLMSLLGSVGGSGASHTFTLRVVDENGEVAQPLVIALEDAAEQFIRGVPNNKNSTQ